MFDYERRILMGTKKKTSKAPKPEVKRPDMQADGELIHLKYAEAAKYLAKKVKGYKMYPLVVPSPDAVTLCLDIGVVEKKDADAIEKDAKAGKLLDGIKAAKVDRSSRKDAGGWLKVQPHFPVQTRKK
jgi:hypothetical protein